MNVAIVGLGLIGGSMAKSIKNRTSHTVWGIDLNAETMTMARMCGAIDAPLTEENLPQADLILVAIRPGAAIEWVRQHAPQIAKSAILVDLCGVKRTVVAAIAPIAEERGFSYIGGHPMAGKEKGGFDNADAALFEGACYILTPTPSTPAAVVDGMKELAAQLGCARMTVTTPAHHDRMIAFTSQLPHVLAGAYVKSPCCLYHAGFSAGSYRDVSRVASVDETLWAQLFLLNQADLCAEIDGLIDRLQACRDAVAAGDRQALTALLRAGRERKEEADGALPPLPEHRKDRTP